MKESSYLDSLALLGVGGAHPGGLQLTKHVLKKENLNPATTILDAGCGTGQTAAYIAQTYLSEVTALDSNPLMIEKAKQRFLSLDLPIKTVQGDAEALPFPDSTFDFVLSESVLAFTSVSRTIQEFKRVLKPKGVLCAVEMVLENNQLAPQEMNEIKDFYGVQQVRTELEWKQAFRDGDFEKINIETYEYKVEDRTVEDVQDFAPSENMDSRYYDILTEHIHLTNVYQKVLGFRIFRCWSY